MPDFGSALQELSTDFDFRHPGPLKGTLKDLFEDFMPESDAHEAKHGVMAATIARSPQVFFQLVVDIKSDLKPDERRLEIPTFDTELLVSDKAAKLLKFA